MKTIICQQNQPEKSQSFIDISDYRPQILTLPHPIIFPIALRHNLISKISIIFIY